MTLLNKTECSALRGLAIIGIFLHNYLHWLPLAQENEYTFTQSNVDRFFTLVSGSDWLWQIFSFFGHYGVPVFVFLSGYGLVLKYEHGSGNGTGFGQFVKHNFMKLFPMMLLGFATFVMVEQWTPMHHRWPWEETLGMLTMTGNIWFSDVDKMIWPGPYWFFGLIMQLYILYYVAIRGRRNWVLAVLVALSWLVQLACLDDPEGDTLNYVRYNFAGNVLPLAMGVWLAREQSKWKVESEKWQMALLLLLSLCAVVFGSMNFHAWLWVPAAVVTGSVAFVKLLPQAALRPLDWMGALSAAIFVAHPTTREILIPLSRHGDLVDGLVLYIVATIVVAMLFRMIIQHMQCKQS